RLFLRALEAPADDALGFDDILELLDLQADPHLGAALHLVVGPDQDAALRQVDGGAGLVDAADTERREEPVLVDDGDGDVVDAEPVVGPKFRAFLTRRHTTSRSTDSHSRIGNMITHDFRVRRGKCEWRAIYPSYSKGSLGVCSRGGAILRRVEDLSLYSGEVNQSRILAMRVAASLGRFWNWIPA